MPETATEPRTWQAGDAEPPVGTTVRRADGREVTLYRLGWMPGPYNWVGILALGPAVEVLSTSGPLIEVATGAAKRNRVHLG